MARLTRLLCALGLARSLHAISPEDNTLLVQVRHVQEDYERFMQPPWDVMEGLPTVGYAFEKYRVGEYVEGKARNGTWLPCIITEAPPGGRYNVHVADSFPGYDLPNVPWQLLRRALTSETSDFYIDNSVLQHQGHGLKYRHSKSLNDKGEEFVSWGSLVVGHDEGDGWVRTSSGYLPYVVHGSQVLRQVERQKTDAFPTFERFVTSFRANLTTAAPSVKLDKESEPTTPPEVTFEAGEIGEFKTKGGGWRPMQVRGPGSIPGTYNIVVRPTDFSVYPVNNARVGRLRKKMPSRVPKEGEAPACNKDGCLDIKVTATADATAGSKKFTLQVARHGRLDMMMRMVCNKMKIRWEQCQKRAVFKHNGQELSPNTFVMSSDLKDQDAVEMELMPPQTEEEEQSAPPTDAAEQPAPAADAAEDSEQQPDPSEETA